MENTKLYKKMYDIMCEVETIEKAMTVGSGSYSYQAVSEKEVLNKIKPLFKKHKLIIFPIDGEIEDLALAYLKTSKGKEEHTIRAITKLKVQYRIVDIESGESQDVVGFGNGADTQDKGAGKAFTYSFKSAICKSFMMFSGEDTDNTHSDDIDGKREEPIQDYDEGLPVSGNIHYCEDCAGEIHATAKSSVETLIAKSQKWYQANLCGPCSGKRYKASHPDE